MAVGVLVLSSEDYRLRDLNNLWLEYDRQNDILYLNFGEYVEEADEEIMSGDDIVIRIKDNRVVSIMIMNFMEKIGVTIC